MSVLDSLYLARKLAVFVGAELLSVAGNVAPQSVARRCWSLALALNEHHTGAALNLAHQDDRLESLERAVACLTNPGDAPASELLAARLPGALLRKLAARALWGAAGEGAAIEDAHDRAIIASTGRRAKELVHRALEAGEPARASGAARIYRSCAPGQIAGAWLEAETLFHEMKVERAIGLVRELIGAGAFESPFDTLIWADRLLAAGELTLATECVARAREWLPEVAETWRIAGRLARIERRRSDAVTAFARALSLDPSHVETHLEHLALSRGWEARPAECRELRLELDAPQELEAGQDAVVCCRLSTSTETDLAAFELCVLAPSGWGLLAERTPAWFDGQGRARFSVRAARADRLFGDPWPLTALAVKRDRFAIARVSIAVRDRTPGRLLLAITEDHEIHEERRVITPELAEHVLVEKSRFASSELGAPWTHLVEVGSTLEMTREAAKSDPRWAKMHARVIDHLSIELERGNGLEVHLHAFNSPSAAHFPYRLDAEGWTPSLSFLATRSETRGDFATACAPPAHAPRPAKEDRSAIVERAVAELEHLIRRAGCDARPVLFRAGLLELGETDGELAWSAVALRSAGLLADSDLPRPKSPFAAAPTAFMASLEQPFLPRRDGPLLQLPIAANLEGDYTMSLALLTERAKKTRRSLEENGALRPGVHLVTLLTHDKLINSRGGRDDRRLAPAYGDWATIPSHVEAWRDAGAEVVTARDGVLAVLDDRSFHPIALLEHETFAVSERAAAEVRFRVRFIGPKTGPDVFVPIRVPCSLRRSLEHAFVLGTSKPEEELEIEKGSVLWIRRSAGERLELSFLLREPIGPRVLDVELHRRGARLILGETSGMRRARLLIPTPPSVAGCASISAVDDRGDACLDEMAAGHIVLGPIRFDRAGLRTVEISAREAGEEPRSCAE